ncbi:hypothetical protein DFH08DRAFT_957535 [Mycena albidolilacea]|uniref:Uncharacterized protein n=1 Tax=Mycena albidolilacea TaxID=1033008 RepID=A0AAD7EVW1_9AGAR|nr:hypothetical protein DFH08DRAFT_957535 [Mycena albidolilacea]
MAEPVDAFVKVKARTKKKVPAASASLPPEIDSAQRTHTATCILVKLPKSTASAPANLMDTPMSAEIPELGDTHATTTDGTPLPVPFSYDASEMRSGLPALQTVLGSSLSGVESETSEMENMGPLELISRTNLLANAARHTAALEAEFREGVDNIMNSRLNVESSVFQVGPGLKARGLGRGESQV